MKRKVFDVLLANAKDVKNVSGKKTDEADAEWIMLMHSDRLLKPSFHPDATARSIRELARHRDNMLRSASKEAIEKLLESTWDVVHLFELKQSYDLYKYIHTQIADCEAEMDRLLDEYTDGCGTDMQDHTATKKRVVKKNAISFDAEKHAFSMWGVNVMEIPGGTRHIFLETEVQRWSSAKLM